MRRQEEKSGILPQEELEEGKIQNLPIIVNDSIESLSKTKDVLKLFNALNLHQYLETKVRIRKGIRRSSKQRQYKKTALIIVKNNSSILKAAGNIAGLDVCTTKSISANLLAPGGNSNRLVIFACLHQYLVSSSAV